MHSSLAISPKRYISWLSSAVRISSGIAIFSPLEISMNTWASSAAAAVSPSRSIAI
jgi:hypothetical protein